MDVVRALLYLRLTSLRNLLHSRLRRLRQPKYAVGSLAAAVYFWFFFFRRRGPGSPGQVFGAIFGEGRAEWITAGVLTLFIVLIWATTSDQPGLSFTEAEVAFLFPAPLRRRQLIHYKLANALFTSLFGALFFAVLWGGLRSGWSGALRYLLFWWMFNANLSLHQMAAALTMSRLADAGLRARRRRLVVYSLAGTILAGVLFTVVRSGPASVAWLLWPARLLVRPLQAGSLTEFYLDLLPSIGFVALQYSWVLWMETPFEEASVARAQKLGEVVARLRSGRSVAFSRPGKARPGPFSLTDRLPPEFAFLWKNLLAAPSYLNRRVFFGGAALVGIGLPWLKSRSNFDGAELANVAAFMALALLVYLMVLGPQVARNDLRGDIIHADLLKTYPLPGWRVVLGSLLAPTLILTAVAWLLLLAAGIGLKAGGRHPWISPEFKIVAGLAAAAVVPALCAVQLIVPNAAALVFPAWAQSGRNPAGGGLDVMGQRLIFFAGQLLCLVAALFPAVALAAGTWFLTGEHGALAALVAFVGLPPPFCLGGDTSPAATVALAALPVLAAFVGEVALGVWLLGPRFEQLDISAELRP